MLERKSIVVIVALLAQAYRVVSTLDFFIGQADLVGERARDDVVALEVADRATIGAGISLLSLDSFPNSFGEAS